MSKRSRHFGYVDTNLTATVAAVVGLIIAAATQNIVVGVATFFVTVVTSGLNIDNVLLLIPIVNRLSPVGRILFLTVGMAISVVGVMIFAPTWFLSLITDQPLGSSIHMAIFNGNEFSRVLGERVSQFIQMGATVFLGMMAITELAKPGKEEHWWTWLESKIARLANSWASIGEVVVGIVAFAIACWATSTNRALLLGVAFGSYLMFKCFHKLSDTILAWCRRPVEDQRWYHSLLIFLFGCLLEGFFSIDGLASAFAITTNMLAIAVGAVTGTLIMRLLTIKLAGADIMNRFQHLEQALFWAILVLAGASGAAVCGFEIPEYITGLVPLAIILGGGFHSHRKNQRARQAVAN